MGFTIFPSFIALAHKNPSYKECTRYSCNILPIYVQELSLYWKVFNILKIMTTTHNDIVCISFNSKSAHSNPPIYIYMQKEDSLSFPTVLGSGGVFLMKYVLAKNGCDCDFYGVLM